jgi:hypothetical protein
MLKPLTRELETDVHGWQLFALRRDITLGNRTDPQGNVDEAWDVLHFMVETLTLGGMSSDESGEDDNGRKIYRIKKRVWRDKEITRLLRFVDRDHNKTNCYGNTRSGNPPRIRNTRSVSESVREAVPGLPRNFYDRTWLIGLSNRDEKELKAKLAVKLPDIEPEE